MNATFNCRLTVSRSPIALKVAGFNSSGSKGVCQFSSPTNGHHALKANLEGLERQYLTLVEFVLLLFLQLSPIRLTATPSINRYFIEWRHQLGQLEQKVALYRAWDVLPESLKRAVAQPPPLLENLRTVVKAERDQVLADAWSVLANYVAGYVSISSPIKAISWHSGVPGGPPCALFNLMMSRFTTLTPSFRPFFLFLLELVDPGQWSSNLLMRPSQISASASS